MANTNSQTLRWFRCLQRMPGARFRLVIFPCAGASASSYGLWAADLPPDLEAFALQLPGRSDRFSEPPVADLPLLVPEVTTAIEPLIDRPTVLLGHSLGALVAFEIVRELRRRSAPLPLHLFVAGRAAPQVPDRDPPIHQLPDDQFMAELISLGGIPKEVAADQELIDLLMPALRADIQMHETYHYLDAPPLAPPITALGGTLDRDVTVKDLREWSTQTSSHFELRMFDGGHFFVHAERQSIVSLILESLIRRRTA